MKLFSLAVKSAEHRRDRTDDSLHLVQPGSKCPTHSRHLCPMSPRSQVMFLVKAIIEGEQIVKPTVVTYGIGIFILRRGAVVFVVVLHVDEHQREDERRQITE